MIYNKITTIDDQIRDEKLQYNINREAAKISALSSGKTCKHEYLTGEDILPSNQQQMIEQGKFIYSPLGKAFKKQTKTIEDHGQKQVEASNTLKSNNEKLAIENTIPENALNNDEAKKELDKIKEIEKNIAREKLVYKTNKYTYSFENFQTIKTFGKNIYDGTITLEEANDYQTDLLAEIINFKEKQNQKVQKKKKKKRLFLKTCIIFLRVEKKVLMLLQVKYFH